MGGATDVDATRGRALRTAVLAAFALVLAQSAAHLVATVGFGVQGSIVDLDRSNGIPDVLSSVIIVGAAFGAVVLSRRHRAGRWRALGLAAALFVVTIEDTLHTGDEVTNSYGRLTVASIVVAALLVIAIAARASRVPRRLLIIGVVLLALDAKAPYAYDQLMNLVGQPWVWYGDFLYELGVVLDEGMELLGWILVGIGLWDLASMTSPAASSRSPKPEKPVAGTATTAARFSTQGSGPK